MDYDTIRTENSGKLLVGLVEEALAIATLVLAATFVVTVPLIPLIIGACFVFSMFEILVNRRLSPPCIGTSRVLHQIGKGHLAKPQPLSLSGFLITFVLSLVTAPIMPVFLVVCIISLGITTLFMMAD